MPITSSAKKAMRQDRTRQSRNYVVRKKVKEDIRAVAEAVKAGKKEDAAKALKAAYKQIDMAAKKNIVHGNKAARQKSRLAKQVATLEAKKK